MTLVEQWVGIGREQRWTDGETCPHVRRGVCSSIWCHESLWVRYWKLDRGRRQYLGVKVGVIVGRPSVWRWMKVEWKLWRAAWVVYEEGMDIPTSVVLP